MPLPTVKIVQGKYPKLIIDGHELHGVVDYKISQEMDNIPRMSLNLIFQWEPEESNKIQ